MTGNDWNWLAFWRGFHRGMAEFATSGFYAFGVGVLIGVYLHRWLGGSP